MNGLTFLEYMRAENKKKYSCVDNKKKDMFPFLFNSFLLSCKCLRGTPKNAHYSLDTPLRKLDQHRELSQRSRMPPAKEPTRRLWV